MNLTYLQKRAAKEIIAVTLHEIQTSTYAAATGWDDLCANVSKPAQELAMQVRELNTKDYGVERPSVNPAEPSRDELEVVSNQTYHTREDTFSIPDRLAARSSYQYFQLMNYQMQEDIGRQLVIQSGYRSPAYQLFVFLFQLQHNDWDVSQTLKRVALPGNSEHAGDPQAFDLRAKTFIGHHDNYDFARTAEFRWMKEHANDFGFYLSYPKNSNTGTQFEPWHWRYAKT